MLTRYKPAGHAVTHTLVLGSEYNPEGHVATHCNTPATVARYEPAGHRVTHVLCKLGKLPDGQAQEGAQ